MLRSLDLFTGIGGMTHALRGIATPKLYCENEPTRIAAIKKLIGKGALPAAPIHDDICTLDTMNYIGSDGEIDIVVGGWPCRGWSVVGKRDGFGHEQSALFFEFVRIVSQTRPALFFQENVPSVLGECPLRTITSAFPEYDCVWLTLPAYAIGAPHTRLRWYCLGIRKDVRTMNLVLDNTYARHSFQEEVPRAVPEKHPIARLSMLGNSVVPDAARLAFLVLFTGFSLPGDTLWNATHLELRRPMPTGKSIGRASATRRYGSCIDGKFQRHMLPEHVIPLRKPDMNLQLIPFSYKGPTLTKAPDEHLRHRPCHRPLWASPRGSNLGASGVLTERSVRDLYTQIRFEKNTPEEQRYGYPNPEWVESYIMGYPKGWTEFE